MHFIFNVVLQGWMPRQFGKEPSRDSRENCMIMTDKFRHPNGSDVIVSYMFWKAVQCSSINGWDYICEKPVSLGFDSNGQSLGTSVQTVILPYIPAKGGHILV